MTGVCISDGCDRPTRNAAGTFCGTHQYRINSRSERRDQVLPKCPGCGTAMREPAVACGFCLIEQPGVA